MTDLFQGESGERLVGVIAILTVCGGPFFVGAWALWLTHRKHERQDEMKREMIERGMSADDIVRVLNAGPSQQSSPGGGNKPWHAP
jgi:hypothetical protein